MTVQCPFNFVGAGDNYTYFDGGQRLYCKGLLEMVLVVEIADIVDFTNISEGGP